MALPVGVLAGAGMIRVREMKTTSAPPPTVSSSVRVPDLRVAAISRSSAVTATKLAKGAGAGNAPGHTQRRACEQRRRRQRPDEIDDIRRCPRGRVEHAKGDRQ